jgi:hypothetical protein
VYVDDIIFGSDDERMIKKFSKDMHNEFSMSLLGELNFFLGLHISQLDDGILIFQTKYIKEMLKKFKMEDYKPASNSMVTSCKLRKYDESKEEDHRLYRSIIGILLYVTTSRPNVMNVVGLVAIFQEALKEAHLMEVKSIFKYLKGTIEFVLWYPKWNDMTMVTHTDADWVGSIDDKRSTIGVSFYLGDCLVSWLSKKKPSISLSIEEA